MIKSTTLFAALAFCAGCPSPANDDAIDALQGECPGVAESEFHRPGQPCVLCHGEYLGVGPEMSVAGTIFGVKDATSPTPVDGATVILTDAAGVTKTATTNCIGNFQLTLDEWQPVFPLHAEIECPVPGSDERRRVAMGTRISRDGSCAGCHFGRADNDSPGWVYCAESLQQGDYEVSPTCPGICQ